MCINRKGSEMEYRFKVAILTAAFAIGANGAVAEEMKKERFFVGVGASTLEGTQKSNDGGIHNSGVKVLLGGRINEFISVEAESFTDLRRDQQSEYIEVGIRYAGIFVKAETPDWGSLPINGFIRGGRIYSDVRAKWSKAVDPYQVGETTAGTSSADALGIGVNYHLNDEIDIRFEHLRTKHTSLDLNITSISTVINF